MERQLLFICFLTFVIHLMGTLAYSVRIAGIRENYGCSESYPGIVVIGQEPHEKEYSRRIGNAR